MPEELLRTADGAVVKEGLYLQDGRTLFKVSTCYERLVALIVCLERGELTDRTRVQEYATEKVRNLRVANQGLVDRYHKLLDDQRDKPGKGLLMSLPTRHEVYDPAILMWYDLCPPCKKAFYAWRDAPNPGAWTNPKIQANPYLLGFLVCRAAGPDPEQWRETISHQLLLIRKLCTRAHNAHNLEYGYPDGFRYA